MALSDREARAMAYRLVEEIETRALRLMADNPGLTDKGYAMGIVLEAMTIMADASAAKRKAQGNG